jgi:hypothetical protein
MTTQILTNVLTAAAIVAAVRHHQVTEFATAAGFEAHAAVIASGPKEEDAAQVVEVALGATLAIAKAAIAEVDATTYIT